MWSIPGDDAVCPTLQVALLSPSPLLPSLVDSHLAAGTDAAETKGQILPETDLGEDSTLAIPSRGHFCLFVPAGANFAYGRN